MSEIYIVGDLHGNSENKILLNSTAWKKKNKIDKNTVIIVVGDFGYLKKHKENPEEILALHDLAKNDYTLCVVDGNHEHMVRINNLKEEDKWGGKVGIIPTIGGNIYHLKRGEVYTIKNKKIFTMGGAMSLPRDHYIANKTWWKEELHTEQEKKNAIKNLEKVNFKVDYVVTHTCPESVIDNIKKKFVLKLNDPCSAFFDYLVKERNLKFRTWHFGHFHLNEVFEVNKQRYQCHYLRFPQKI